MEQPHDPAFGFSTIPSGFRKSRSYLPQFGSSYPNAMPAGDDSRRAMRRSTRNAESFLWNWLESWKVRPNRNFSASTRRALLSIKRNAIQPQELRNKAGLWRTAAVSPIETNDEARYRRKPDRWRSAQHGTQIKTDFPIGKLPADLIDSDDYPQSHRGHQDGCCRQDSAKRALDEHHDWFWCETIEADNSLFARQAMKVDYLPLMETSG
jgi:hypothetical protein